MKGETVSERIARWGATEAGAHMISLHTYIEHLAERVFCEYEPTSTGPEFWPRCRAWLDCVADEQDQQLMLEMVAYLAFVTSGEFQALYREALHEHVVRWLADRVGVMLDAATAGTELERAIEHTWFCPITDSMRISAFYHVNHIRGVQYRPDWRSLAKFADPQKIAQHMAQAGVERLVLLEDFVGSGEQIKNGVEFAGSLPGSPPVLVIPLIICPEGLNECVALHNKFSHVDYAPVIALPKDAMVTDTPEQHEPPIYKLFRDLAGRLAPIVPGLGVGPKDTPLGYRGTGSLVVMYTNTPDNTLPLVHRRTDQWCPLFPRASRT